MKEVYISKTQKFVRTLWMSIVCVLVFSCLFAGTAYAENATKVVDGADLLTTEEEEKLQELYSNITNKYGVDVVLLTTESCEGETPEKYTDDYYYNNDYGCEPDKSGILLMVSMGDRKFHMSTNGYAIDAFTDYGMQRMDDMITEDLTDGEYYKAFKKYGDLCDEFLKEAIEKGIPFDTNHRYKEHMPLGKRAMISFGAGLVFALLSLFGMNVQLDRAKLATEAGAYIRPGSFQVTRSKDLFLYRNITSQKIEKSSGGGSTTHDNGHGSSSGGHTGSF